MGTEEPGSVEIHLPSEYLRELIFHGQEGEPRNVTGLELHEDVDIALRSEVGSQNRTEQRELPDMMTATERRDRLLVHGKLGSHERLSQRRS